MTNSSRSGQALSLPTGTRESGPVQALQAWPTTGAEPGQPWWPLMVVRWEKRPRKRTPSRPVQHQLGGQGGLAHASRALEQHGEGRRPGPRGCRRPRSSACPAASRPAGRCGPLGQGHPTGPGSVLSLSCIFFWAEREGRETQTAQEAPEMDAPASRTRENVQVGNPQGGGSQVWAENGYRYSRLSPFAVHSL